MPGTSKQSGAEFLILYVSGFKNGDLDPAIDLLKQNIYWPGDLYVETVL